MVCKTFRTFRYFSCYKVIPIRILMPSSVISHFSYDQDAAALYITFVSGIRYKYRNVPQEVYHMLKAAGSKGRYFNHYIKNKFRYSKLRQ